MKHGATAQIPRATFFVKKKEFKFINVEETKTANGRLEPGQTKILKQKLCFSR